MIASQAKEMGYLFFLSKNFLLALATQDAWIPSKGFLYVVLIFGALFLAGVALSAFTYYEDHYWGDSKYREELRTNPSRRDF
mgnify:FL=1